MLQQRCASCRLSLLLLLLPVARCPLMPVLSAVPRPQPIPLPAAAVKLLEEEARRLQRSRLKLRLQPVSLYAGLPAAHQLGVFEPAPRGVRKVSAYHSPLGRRGRVQE